MLIINHDQVREILADRELDLIDLVGRTYAMHDEGDSVLPHSSFLRFPNDSRNRIIGLPGYLGGTVRTAGIKWIASFPGNITAGRERASAAIILNSTSTGRPEALIEGSLISSRRTAASAVLGARMLTPGPPTGISLIGGGVINLEILRFTAAWTPGLSEITVFDLDPERAAAFAQRCRAEVPKAEVVTAPTAEAALAAHRLVSIATNAVQPHLNLKACAPGTVVLHVSLRDLTPETILTSRNVVDDVSHVCREKTSLHLAQERCGKRDFIDTTIGALVRGTGRVRPRDDAGPVIFSPFGLGVLDLALADLVLTEARSRGLGTAIDDFLPGVA